MSNKFGAALAERKTTQLTQSSMTDLDKFIQSAASDGALAKEPEPQLVVEQVEPEKAPESPLDRLFRELAEHQETVRSTRKKGKIERVTASMHKEQLMKADIIKMLLEDEKGINLSMSQVIAMLIDKKFDEFVKGK